MPSPRLVKLYRAVRSATGSSASYCLDRARTLAKWDAAASAGYVRLRAEWDEYLTHDDLCDCDRKDCKARTHTAMWTCGEYRTDLDSDEWIHADSVGGHIGYRDVLDWEENPYILDMMAETIDQFRDARKANTLVSPVPAW